MKKWPWFVLSILVLALDQFSKYYALAYLDGEPVKAILPMLNFSVTYNTGAAFGFLHTFGDWHRWLFALISLVISVALAIWLARLPPRAFLPSISISLILGGALGNLCDRLFLGHVIDFIDLHYQNYHWPLFKLSNSATLFNLADAAICLGAFLLLFCFNTTTQVRHHERSEGSQINKDKTNNLRDNA